ncbi:MAG: GNAT family N-acetyltransferase [Candidatus Peregrinibacteria bacterium]
MGEPTEEFDDYDYEDKGGCHSRPFPRISTDCTLPSYVHLPETQEPTIVEIVQDRRRLILYLLRFFGLRGESHVVEQTRLDILVLGRQLLGFTTVTPLAEGSPGQNGVRLDWIYVDEDHRGHKYSRKLWDYVLASNPSSTITGKIIDQSGAVKHMAEKSGAIQTGQEEWKIER